MPVKFKTPIVVDGQVTAEYLDLSTTTSHIVDAGEIAWNPIDGTFDIGMLNGVTLQEGQELYFYAKATEAILNGDAVMFAGVQGDHLLIAKADRVVLNANPNYFMGVATQRFEVNEFGYVTAFGKVRELDTTAYTLGATLYYDSTSPAAGLLTETMPAANQAKIEVAAVVRVHATQGILMVRPHIMPILNEIQDVDVTLSKVMPIDADSLFLQDTADQNIWKKLSWSNVKATLKTYFDTLYQKGTGTTNYVPKFTGSSTLGNSQIFDNGTNVGIGTTTPPYKFSVYDTSDGVVGHFGGGVSNYTLISFRSNEANVYSTSLGSYNSGMLFRTGATDRMYINSGGKVGIGTTSPTGKLSILDGYYNTFFSDTSSQYGSGLILSGDAGSDQRSWRTFVKNGNGSVALTFEVSTNGTSYGNSPIGLTYAERMRITSGGNVGIGTTAPTFKLDILSSGANTRINSADANGSYLVFANNGTAKAYIGSAYHLFGSPYNVANDLGLRSDAAMSFSTGGTPVRMRITSGGNVGIGTTNTIHQLSVASKIGGATFGDSFIEFPSSGNTIVKANNDVILGYLQSTSIKQSGNIGVGIVNPSASAILHLNSNSQGFLPPVMNQSERDSIGAPEQGLMIFNTDTETIDVFTNGGGWKSLSY